MSPRSANGRNWSVSEVDERAGEAARLEVAGDLAEEVGERDGQQQQPDEDDERASA